MTVPSVRSYLVESEYAHGYMRIVTGDRSGRADPAGHGVIGGGCHAVTFSDGCRIRYS